MSDARPSVVRIHVDLLMENARKEGASFQLIYIAITAHKMIWLAAWSILKFSYVESV